MTQLRRRAWPGRSIAGVNQYTVGFASSIVGTIAAYHAGIRRVAGAPEGR